jgi:Xaa-Pro dipeptidase
MAESAPALYAHRQARLAQALAAAGMEALALNPGPTLTYLTGLHFHLSERPTLALFAPGAPVRLVLPVLESGKASQLPFESRVFTFDDDPASWPAAYQAAARAARLSGQRVAVEQTRLRVLELRLLEAAAETAQYLAGEAVLAALRMFKDAAEIAAMRRAVAIAQQALAALLPQIQPGQTERQLASELTLQLLRHGSEAELPFAPIIASGPNSANPHSALSDRPLAPGDLLIVDWGAAHQGYFSDLTRTFAIGKPAPELIQIGEIVQAANAAGRAACRPGVTCGEVDAAARQVIEASGYGPYFIHRTGHGLGLETHEEPYIRAGNPLPLAAGMTFTIEPGIYLPGRGGVRVEDNVVATSSGAETLSDTPRHLILIG